MEEINYNIEVWWQDQNLDSLFLCDSLDFRAWKHMTALIHTWGSPGDKGIALLVVLPYMQNFSIPRSLNKLCPQVSLVRCGTQFHFWANSRDWEIAWDNWHRLDFLKNKHFSSQPKKPELASKSQIHFQTSARAFSQLILHHPGFFLILFLLLFLLII